MIRQNFTLDEKKNFTESITPGQDIIVTGFIGIEGTEILAGKYADRLKVTLPEEFVEEAADLRRKTGEAVTVETARKFYAEAMISVDDGGIFAALWKLAAVSDMGFEVRLRDIPIRQETIEVCEVLDVNPYCLKSGECAILIADNGYRLARHLESEGIKARVIGEMTAKKDKILMNSETKGCLNRPEPDEILRMI